MPDYFLSSQDFEPAYWHLYQTGELKQRAHDAIQTLAYCLACPRHCGEDRLADKTGVCKTGRFARVSSYFPHMGEENCLRGSGGSGTIFFSSCNLRCPFCQNYDISLGNPGKEARPERLAGMMLELQATGCHNINLVTPDHVVPQILEALVIAVERGLRLPIVYNTSSYVSLETLRLMDGVVDIYMPDFKIWDSRFAVKYVAAKNYPEVARCSIKEMHRQVGELKMDENGLAKRGLLVRHLVMPGKIAGTGEVARFLAREVSIDTYINVMAQYSPAGKVSNQKFADINRCITPKEYTEAVTATQKAGLYRFDGK